MNDRYENAALAPKPVHPTAVRTNKLFGITFLREHMLIDPRWTISSVTDQYKNMASLLARRFIFKRLEFNAKRKRYNHENSLLRRQCREGRIKLKMSIFGRNAQDVRNKLINHKDMQRLYQHMPIHEVVENINQRTFVMRKERDRLRFRLDQLKEIYRNKMLQRAQLETRIKYQNEFILDDDKKAHEFLKKIQSSKVRLIAIKTIHGSYTKIIQVLRHDSIFYDPILKALSNDIEDQSNFVKHVLHIGIPALSKFQELGEIYASMENKSRKYNQARLLLIADYKNKEKMRAKPSPQRGTMEMSSLTHRYVRETESMLELKSDLEYVENVIKTVKFATLCSEAKEIFPRMKAQVDNNLKLKKAIEQDMLGHNVLDMKMQRAKVLKGISINSLSEAETLRLEQIQSLQDALDREYKLQEDTIKYMKNRADVFVVLRFALWNANEILRHVGRKLRPPVLKYPTSYLKLPLLKFEMFTMRSYPPELYDANLDNLLIVVRRKLTTLMDTYKAINENQIIENTNIYHTTFLEEMDRLADSDETDEEAKQEEDEEALIDVKIFQNVPSRKQIKEKSAKIVEEFSRKED